MLLNLIHKELLSHLRTLRLVVALAFTVLLCSLTTLMGSLDYSVSVDTFEAERTLLRERVENTPVLGCSVSTLVQDHTVQEQHLVRVDSILSATDVVSIRSSPMTFTRM